MTEMGKIVVSVVIEKYKVQHCA